MLPASTQTSRKAEEAEVIVVTNAGDPNKYSVSSLYTIASLERKYRQKT